MIKISHYSETPQEHIGMQIVSLAAENFTEISLYGTPEQPAVPRSPSSPGLRNWHLPPCHG